LAAKLVETWVMLKSARFSGASSGAEHRRDFLPALHRR
jgi:hypothetical protein